MMKKWRYTLVAVFSLTLTSYGQIPGTFNTAFGNNGVAWCDDIMNSDQAGLAMALQPDGKIVVGGMQKSSQSNQDFFVWRIHVDGTFDYSFGINGRYLYDVHDDEQVNGLAVLPDGKILMAGSTQAGPNDWNILLHRLNADGTPDSSFATDGKVEIDPSIGGIDRALGVEVGSGGKIYIGGFMALNGEIYFLSIRLNADGTLDTSWSVDGISYVKMNAPGEAFDMQLAPDGSLFICGVVLQNGDARMAVVKFDANGIPDNSFAGDGSKIFNSGLGNESMLNGMAILPNGNILGVGAQNDGNSVIDGLLIQLTPSGLLDGSFNGNGIMTIDINGTDEYFKMVKLLTNGNAMIYGFIEQQNEEGLLLQVKPDGNLETSYGGNGKGYVILDHNSSDESPTVFAMNNSFLYTLGYGNSGTNYDVIIASTHIYNNVGLPETNLILNDVTVFPNPASGTGELTIRFEEAVQGDIIISMYNLPGSKVFQAQFQKTERVLEYTLPLRDFGRGIYLLQAENNGRKTTQKIIIE